MHFNAALVHLGLNHVPLVAVFLGIAIFVLGQLRNNEVVAKVGLLLLLFASVVALPVFFSGEPAEDIVEKLPGISKDLIHDHEEAAEMALVFMELTGAVVLAWFVINIKKKALAQYVGHIVVVLALVTGALFLRAAHYGGNIQHAEIRGQERAP